MESKQDLRIKAKSIRKTLAIEERSRLAVELIRQNSVYASAENVMFYYPMKYELNLLDLLNDDKKFYLPKVCAKKLLICPFQRGDRLIKSVFNVCEPCSNPIDLKELDLVIVPALMADGFGYRLGYGGGFYDRFLAENIKIKTLLPIAKELFVKELPHERFDKKIDEIIVV